MTDEQLAAIEARAARTRAIRVDAYPLTPAEADREALLAEVRRQHADLCRALNSAMLAAEDGRHQARAAAEVYQEIMAMPAANWNAPAIATPLADMQPLIDDLKAHSVPLESVLDECLGLPPQVRYIPPLPWYRRLWVVLTTRRRREA